VADFEDMATAGDGRVAAVYPTRASARERSSVLLAKGVPHWVLEVAGGFALVVPAADHALATSQLGAYDREQAEAAAAEAPAAPPQQPGAAWPLAGAALVLGAIHWWRASGRPDPADLWARDGARMVDHGEWWRAATALLVHADLAHLIGNLFFGSLFAWFVLRAFGPWLGLTWIILSGVLGNLGVALTWYPDPFRAIGASTAVFGAVGLLVGHGIIWAHPASGLRGHRAWLVPLGGGLGLLGMFGSGGEHAGVDLAAHLYGFLAGLALGMTAAAVAKHRLHPGRHPAPNSPSR
jgi:membrane associated rhomboid family serine protease